MSNRPTVETTGSANAEWFVEGGTSAHKLADAVGVGLATLTGIVDRLEARDWSTAAWTRTTAGPAHRPHNRGRTLVSDFIELGRERKRYPLRRLDLRVLWNLVEAVEVMRDTLAARKTRLILRSVH